MIAAAVSIYGMYDCLVVCGAMTFVVVLIVGATIRFNYHNAKVKLAEKENERLRLSTKLAEREIEKWNLAIKASEKEINAAAAAAAKAAKAPRAPRVKKEVPGENHPGR